ncbi:DUF429 domain-containing protein [Halobaculum limi]|uniref:DUF429 domain-containing protein n=1 Tax=Halobaculum limi TaxID=3031916 RepID=UPI002406EE8D|nr:DUF429 domain-containing protein [Halobaculum sp. YSMS11]
MSSNFQADTVYGVDFSAAANSAGASTWVARCVQDGEELVVNKLASASEYLDIDSNDRSDVLPALADHLGSGTESTVAGLDFPFSLPEWVLSQSNGWREFVQATPDQWGILEQVDEPKDLFYRLNAQAEETKNPQRRATDDEHKGQNPAGWRIKTQTYYGISILLRRLIEFDQVAVPPVLTHQNPRLTVLETYPASVFDDLEDATRTGYKKGQRRHVEARQQNVEALQEAGVRFADQTARDCAVATDDALDAVAAAYAAHRNYPEALTEEYDQQARLEAQIFA